MKDNDVLILKFEAQLGAQGKRIGCAASLTAKQLEEFGTGTEALFRLHGQGLVEAVCRHMLQLKQLTPCMPAAGLEAWPISEPPPIELTLLGEDEQHRPLKQNIKLT